MQIHKLTSIYASMPDQYGLFSDSLIPQEFIIGEQATDGLGRVVRTKDSRPVVVTRITTAEDFNDPSVKIKPGNYVVITDDGHVRAVPENAFIAEWSL